MPKCCYNATTIHRYDICPCYRKPENPFWYAPYAFVICAMHQREKGWEEGTEKPKWEDALQPTGHNNGPLNNFHKNLIQEQTKRLRNLFTWPLRPRGHVVHTLQRCIFFRLYGDLREFQNVFVQNTDWNAFIWDFFCENWGENEKRLNWKTVWEKLGFVWEGHWELFK